MYKMEESGCGSKINVPPDGPKLIRLALNANSFIIRSVENPIRVYEDFVMFPWVCVQGIL